MVRLRVASGSASFSSSLRIREEHTGVEIRWLVVRLTDTFFSAGSVSLESPISSACKNGSNWDEYWEFSLATKCEAHLCFESKEGYRRSSRHVLLRVHYRGLLVHGDRERDWCLLPALSRVHLWIQLRKASRTLDGINWLNGVPTLLLLVNPSDLSCRRSSIQAVQSD